MDNDVPGLKVFPHLWALTPTSRKEIARHIFISKVQFSNKIRVYDLRRVIRLKTERMFHTFYLAYAPCCYFILNAFFVITFWVVCSALFYRDQEVGVVKIFYFLCCVSIFEEWSHYLRLASSFLQLLILQPPPPTYWEDRHPCPYLGYGMFVT